MKVAIAYPPIPSPKGVPLLSQNRQFQWFHRPTYIYPVVPACAATMAEKAGHEVAWLDGIAAEWSPEEFLRQLAAARPDVVMIEAKTPIVKAYWAWVARLKEIRPDMRIAMAGDHVTALPEETLRHCPADFVLTGGDYDFLLVNLLAHLRDGAPLEAGIWRREGTAFRPPGAFVCQHDLRAMPRIDRERSRWRLYSEKNGNFRRLPGTYIMSGRDCWHGRCTFCSWTTLYPNYRTRAPTDVVDEIGELVDRYGVREIMDDTGTFPVGDWLRAFCEEMIRRGYPRKVTLDANMRFGRLGLDDYRLMEKAGFRFVLFGLESANQATLDRLQKGLRVEDIRAGAEAAARAGLDVHVTVMFGYPWEGREEIARTVRLARELMARGFAHTLQCTLVIPYPGTPLFRECDEQDLLVTRDWDEYDMRRAIMKSKATEDDIKGAIREVYRSFVQPGALYHRFRRIRHPGEDLRFYWRGLRSLAGHLKDFRG